MDEKVKAKAIKMQGSDGGRERWSAWWYNMPAICVSNQKNSTKIIIITEELHTLNNSRWMQHIVYVFYWNDNKLSQY